MILFIGKYILIPALLTWTAWIPLLATHYPTPHALLLFNFLTLHKNSSLLITALLSPYLCLLYDTYRGASRRIQFIVGAFFVLATLFSNLLIRFLLSEALPELLKDWETVLRIADKIRAF